jgi:eukaryotic-like serine/threonine-protein kinase
MAESEVDPLVGKVLSGRFEIVAPLGIGGMGRVYKAVQQPLGREVALKVLNPRYDGMKDPGFERRFFLEASMTSKLKHPNTITVHDYGRTDDGIYFLAMELLEGETLQKVLADNGRLPWARAIYIAGQIARSLREAHKLGMVHRDLKPANVMLMTEGTGGDTVKVLDFGLVKSFTPEKPKDDEVDRTGLTQAGVLLGSPLYMAPEQARGEADPRTDIYALGVLMFQTMAGRPPFVSKESIDVIVKHIREKPPELRSLAPEVTLEVNALVMKCLEKEPSARFQSMDELLDAMRVATAGQGLSGAFADPRTQSGLMPRTSTPGQPSVSANATPSFTSAESVRSLEVEMGSLPNEVPPRRLRLILGVGLVIVLGAGVGGVVAWKAMRPEPVIAPPKPVEPPKVEPVVVVPSVITPAEVRFEIDSQPQGASVTRDGVSLGVTPFSFTLPRKDNTALQVELAFALEGYETQSVVAQGSDGVVTISKTLNRKAPSVRPITKPIKKPKNPTTEPNGYKDDPY